MNIYKRLFVVAALCSMLATTISEATHTVNAGYLTIGLNNSQDDNYVSYEQVGTTDVYKAKGFDISMYCFIARHIGLRPQFVAYSGVIALATALADKKIDCFGGATFDLLSGFQNSFYGVVTTTTENVTNNGAGTDPVDFTSFGIAFVAQGGLQADLPCSLMKQVELAVNLAVSSGAYACYAAQNNYNVNEADVVVGNLIAPTPFYSTTIGTIPAPINGVTPFFGCTDCSATLARTSCLVDYLLTKGTGCNVIVKDYVVPS